MALVLIFMGTGSTLLAFLITWQVRVAGTDLTSVAKYNFFILPALFVANTLIGLGLNRGHSLYKALPLWVATQSFFYYFMIALFSIVILDNKFSPIRAVSAFALIIIAIYLLKS